MAGRSDPPWYYLIDERPARIARNVEGGLELVVLDFASGDLRVDPPLLQRCLSPDASVVEIDAGTFEARVASLRSQLGTALGPPPPVLRVAHFRDARTMLEIELRTGQYRIGPVPASAALAIGRFDETEDGLVAFFRHDQRMFFLCGGVVHAISDPSLSLAIEPVEGEALLFTVRRGGQTIWSTRLPADPTETWDVQWGPEDRDLLHFVVRRVAVWREDELRRHVREAAARTVLDWPDLQLTYVPEMPGVTTMLTLDRRGSARLAHGPSGQALVWTGGCEPAVVEALVGALRAGGFPAAPVQRGEANARIRTLYASGGGELRVAAIGWDDGSRLRGFAEAFRILDALVDHTSGGNVRVA